MNNNVFCKIKVTNLQSKAVYFHSRVPYKHVEMLMFSPNLSVDVLGQYREYQNERNYSKKGSDKSIIN